MEFFRSISSFVLNCDFYLHVVNKHILYSSLVIGVDEIAVGNLLPSFENIRNKNVIYRQCMKKTCQSVVKSFGDCS